MFIFLGTTNVAEMNVEVADDIIEFQHKYKRLQFAWNEAPEIMEAHTMADGDKYLILRNQL